MRNNKLKAFVRFDGSGKVVPSSVILQRSKPKVGNWKEIDANECCNGTTTTTTTASLNICLSFVDRGVYTPSLTYTYIGNDINGYSIYENILFEATISYFILENVWKWYRTTEGSILSTSEPTITTNIFDVVWPGDPALVLILPTPCDI